MDENEVVWPWGMSDREPDPASRPSVFDPHGFVVAVVEDDDEAETAKAALGQAGFGQGDLRSSPAARCWRTVRASSPSSTPYGDWSGA